MLELQKWSTFLRRRYSYLRNTFFIHVKVTSLIVDIDCFRMIDWFIESFIVNLKYVHTFFKMPSKFLTILNLKVKFMFQCRSITKLIVISLIMLYITVLWYIVIFIRYITYYILHTYNNERYIRRWQHASETCYILTRNNKGMYTVIYKVISLITTKIPKYLCKYVQHYIIMNMWKQTETIKIPLGRTWEWNK